MLLADNETFLSLTLTWEQHDCRLTGQITNVGVYEEEMQNEVPVLLVEVSGSLIIQFTCVSFYISISVIMSEGPTVMAWSFQLSHFMKLKEK